MLSRHLHSLLDSAKQRRAVGPATVLLRRSSGATDGPVAAGTDQASAKDEDLGRTVIGTVELAAEVQSAIWKPVREADGSVSSSPGISP